MLYGSDNLSEIDLDSYLTQLSGALTQTYSVDPSKVIINIEPGGVTLNAKMASSLGLIINELLSNALKYAFPDDRNGEITVRSKKPGSEVELTISDNGIGMTEGFNWRNTDSLGLKLVRSLAEDQLGGSVEMESNNGTKFTIKFNLDSYYKS